MISPKNNEIRLVVYFDGVCNLCNFWVKWIRKIDRKSRFELRSLQSAEGKEFIKKYQMESGLAPDSVVYHKVVLSNLNLNNRELSGVEAIDRENSDAAELKAEGNHRVVKEQVYFESNAVLNILKDSGFWGKTVFWLLRLIPKFIRDAAYRWVASNRYKWFGTCELKR